MYISLTRLFNLIHKRSRADNSLLHSSILLKIFVILISMPSRIFKTPRWHYVQLGEKHASHLNLDMEALEKKWNKLNYNCTERIWDLKRRIRIKTWLSQKQVNGIVTDIPSHVMCVNPPAKAKSLFSQTKLALDFLFSHILDVNSQFVEMMNHEKEMYIASYKNRGLVYFPTNKLHDYEMRGRCDSPEQFRAFLRSDARLEVIDDFWAEYMKIICQHLTGSRSITEQQRVELEEIINNQGTLYLLKYEPGAGIWMHIDNLLRSDATVFTIGLGRRVIYDMTRVIGRQKGTPVTLLRSSKPEGTRMVMDGASRYEWAHGVPYGGKKRNGTKYTIILRVFHHKRLSRFVRKCKTLDVDMYTML